MNPFLTEKCAAVASPLHRLDARSKLTAFFLLAVAAVSTPASSRAAFAGYFLILAAAVLVSRVPLRHYLLRLSVVLPFVLLAALSLLTVGDSESAEVVHLGIADVRVSQTGLVLFTGVLMKASAGVLALSVLSLTTSFPSLLWAMERLGMPQVLTLTAGFAYRYLFVLVDEIFRMKRAGDSRLHSGRWLWHAKTTGRIIAALFLRSYERAERVYNAMLSRGFDGSWLPSRGKKLTPPDWAFAGVMILLLAFVRFTLG